ncbi:hypothetical protein RSOLAG1IB_02428 [Rhizoctonia solani AG-1 IB]|uniref:Required for respiratory growth protein 9, mitochondrial n=1 Tax=Thanatephorus cucumeris (strain AG1-IB / isolate 7/3/14) TaxID=1108050 RepID=A0A0B7FJ57_THACB|nr:hypothetical protein RSOLAG1IB_02428 [Rhizoctonia solani AG-1 IB]
MLAELSSSKLWSKKPIMGKTTLQAPNYNENVPKVTLSRRERGKRISLQKQPPNPVPKATSTKPQYPPRPASRPRSTPAEYKLHRERIKRNFPDGWAPPRTISREAMEVLRRLHASDSVQYRTPVLANKFKISPEAVSRILKSKWRPSPERIAKAIARENLNKDKRIAEKIKAERAEAVKSLDGRLDITEKSRGKDKLTMK